MKIGSVLTGNGCETGCETMTDGYFVGFVFVISVYAVMILSELHSIKEILKSIERKIKSEID